MFHEDDSEFRYLSFNLYMKIVDSTLLSDKTKSTSHIYDASDPSTTSSGRTSSPSYGPIHVPTGMICFAQTP